MQYVDKLKLFVSCDIFFEVLWEALIGRIYSKLSANWIIYKGVRSKESCGWRFSSIVFREGKVKIFLFNRLLLTQKDGSEKIRYIIKW